MAFNVQEKQILDMIYYGKGTIEEISEIFKQGADPNAIENELHPFNYINNEPYYDTLFREMLFNSIVGKKHDIKDLLECVIDNGLDVNKFGSSVIGDLHFVDYESDDIYEMCKMILNSCTEKITLTVAKDKIGTEESYMFCCHPLDDLSLELKYASYLYGLYELLEAYEKGRDYVNYYSFDNVIGKTVKSFNINGSVCMLNKRDFRVKPLNGYTYMETIIRFDDDQLVIEGTSAAYVYNGNKDSEFNSFSYDISSVLIGKTLEEINFAPSVQRSSSEKIFPIYNLELKFSDGYSLMYYRNKDETEGVRLINERNNNFDGRERT